MKSLLFAAAAWNLAETTRMLEIAKASRGEFACAFLSYGGQFEHLIATAGFRDSPWRASAYAGED